MNTQNHLKKIALLKAMRLYGNADKMAQSIGATRSQVNNWLNRGDRVPYQYALIIATSTGIQLTFLAPYAAKANDIVCPLIARYRTKTASTTLITSDT